ncbi:MAG: SMC-Scp complex subunit ScpB [Candidatus Aenigmatarchaeota archaeon]
MSEETEATVEAALFISSGPLTLQELKKVSDASKKEVREALEGLREAFSDDSHGVELFKSLGGYELRVKPEYLGKVSHLTPYSDLSRGQLKVLALVAFKGPIKQSNIAKIIGNRAYSYIKDLERKNLIRSEKHKRTKKLEITDEFKSYFGIEEKEELEEKLEEALGKEEAEDLKEEQ